MQLGAYLFAFSRYCPTGGEIDAHLDPLAYRALLDALHRKFEAYKAAGCATKFALKDHLWTLYRYEEGLFEVPDGTDEDVIYDGCNCGSNHLTILPDGQVYACRRMESPVGNVFERSLHDLFLSPAMDAYRNIGGMEKCSHCELVRFCRGCPAVAAGVSGSHLAADPQCWKDIPADATVVWRNPFPEVA